MSKIIITEVTAGTLWKVGNRTTLAQEHVEGKEEMLVLLTNFLRICGYMTSGKLRIVESDDA